MSAAAPEIAPLGGASRLRRVGRLLLKALAFGAGIGLVLVIAGLCVYWYSNRPTPVKDWPVLRLSNLGVNASLRTRWSDGSLGYQFSVSPDQGLEKAFSQVAHNGSNRFIVHLSDKDGFELCDFEPKLTVTVGDTGEPTVLHSNGSSFGCGRSKVQDASKWQLTFVFPRLADIKASEHGPWEKYQQKNQRSTPDEVIPNPLPVESLQGRLQKPQEVTGEDTLTGIDLDGHVETKSGHSFVITREAEKIPANVSWHTRASLRYSCKRRNDCVIENTDTGETVHARLIR